MNNVRESYLSEYFGLWMVYQSQFEKIVSKFEGFNLKAHIEANSDHKIHAMGDEGTPYRVVRPGVAQIDVCGPMMKYSSSMSANCSTTRVRREISHAIANDDIEAILFNFDTPGGTVSGTQDLANAVARATREKKTVAFVEDLVASAGYWVASQCDEIIANQPTALVGSIGTYAILEDASEAAEKAGYKVHVIRAGEFKGMGTLGTQITEEQVAEYQRLINSMNSEFLDGVASGRGVARAVVEQWADGRVHPANTAKDLGLIDDVRSYDETLDQLFNSISGASTMTKTTTPASNQSEATDPIKTETTTVENPETEDQSENETPDNDTTSETSESETDGNASARTQLAEYMEAFGKENGATWFAEGLTFEQATAKENEVLKAENETLRKAIQQADRSEGSPVSSSDDMTSQKKRGGMASKIRIAKS